TRLPLSLVNAGAGSRLTAAGSAWRGGDRAQLALSQLFIEPADFLVDQPVELILNVAQLTLQSVDTIELVARRLPFPGHQGGVKVFGVLADPLLAGDRAAFLGGDHHFLDVVESAGHGDKLLVQLVVLGYRLERNTDRGTSPVDAIHQRAHRAEQR